MTEVDEYAYGSGSPGALTRKTLTSYASLGNGIVGMPLVVKIEDGSSNIKSQTTFGYSPTVTSTVGTPQKIPVTGDR